MSSEKPITAPTRTLPVVLVLAATTLFALGPALLKLLMERGAEVSSTGSISFCNVLFVGNLCASGVVLSYGGVRRISSEIVNAPPRKLAYLALAAITTAVYPALLFTALERTSVINVVLLSRFNGIATLILAWLLLGTRLRGSEALGYGVMAAGVVVLLLSNDAMPGMSSGDALVLLAALFFAATEILSRKILPITSVHTYMFVRNFFSAILFFSVALVWFGPEHFADAFRGDLWVLMLAYAGVAIVLAQFLWLSATPRLPLHFLANVQLLNPVFSIAFAFALLGEVPAGREWLVMVIVLAGMLLPYLLKRAGRREPPLPFAMDTGLVAK